jgi:hypothetical protein
MSSSRPPAWTAILLGLLALAAIPAGGVASAFISSVSILKGILVAVPVAVVLGLAGLSAARRARFRVERSVYRVGERVTRWARVVVWLGLYVAMVGALALGFYGVLRAKS